MHSFKNRLLLLLGLVLIAGWGASLLVSLRVERALFEDVGLNYHYQVRRAFQEKLNLVAFHGPAWHEDSLGQVVRQGTTVKRALFISPSGQVLNGHTLDSLQTFPPDSLHSWATLGDSARILSQGRGHDSLRIVSPMSTPASCGACHASPHVAFLLTDMAVPPHRVDPLRLHLFGLVFLVAAACIVMLSIRAIHLRKVQGRLELIQHVLERVEHGDYTEQVPEPKDVELQGLTRAINRMLGQLLLTQRQVEEKHGRQLMRADQLASMGELAAGVAHEIKNPVAGILGAVTVILKETPVQDPLRPVFVQIQTQINRVNDAINDLLSYARPAPPKLVEFLVADLLSNVLPLIRKQASATGVVVAVIGDQDAPPVWADPLQISQVLVNLMLNAIQAMPEGGTLTARVSHLDATRQVAIEIQDEGSGVPTERQEEIFRPFYTTKHRGTGLGLPISRRIMEAHGGDLVLVNRPGTGALFIVYLPAKMGVDAGATTWM